MNEFSKKTLLKIFLLFLGLTIIIIGIIFVSLVFYHKNNIEKEKLFTENFSIKDELAKQNPQHIVTAGNYSMGSQNPEVTIIKFSDFTCPYCQEISVKLRNIVFKYPDKVKLVYKDYPVVNEEGVLLSLAGRCAGEQGMFWAMHDVLFSNPTLINENNIYEIANQTDLNVEKFNSCIKEEKYLDDIKQDSLEAEKVGVQITPTVFINGYIFPGDISEIVLTEIVESFLTNKPITK